MSVRYAGLRVQQLVTATTFMVLTNVNKFIVIFFGVVALREPITPTSAMGMLMAIGGAQIVKLCMISGGCRRGPVHEQKVCGGCGV